ncbi:RNA-binding protein 26 [Puccinia graminis f. sp. tritici]|uniref:RNA-binding protein 26 n=1 Tax=Puccinia graminis f. sp. tritici TaxID=56615 RepID=A0A5B0S7F2_PUCGR|nr:RNA-binding protein 26 [Puccinia graminis f. sp. tritici]
MILEQKQSDYLKQWMVQKLKPICDADHEVLSEYVMALLRHDQSENQLRSSCLKQLEDFLQQDTKLFVTDLFDHLRTFGAFNGSYQPPEINLSASVLLRKRSLAVDEPYLLPNNNQLDNQHRPSQSSTAPIPQYTPTQSHPSFLHFPEPQSNLINPLPSFNPSSHTQQPPYNNTNTNQPRNSKRPRRSICRDYHYRGYCARGSSCHFSHDDRDQDASSSSTQSSAYFSKTLPAETQPTTAPPSATCIPLVFSSTSVGQQIPGLGGPLTIPYDLPIPSFSSSNPPEQQSGNDQSNHYNSRHPDRSTRFNGPTSNTRKPFTTLFIENIPQSSLSDRAVREYFSMFGPLTNVTLDVHNSQAQVTFKSTDDAKRAYSSPEPVFNNRFVRIHIKRVVGTGPRRSHGPLRTDASPAAEGFSNNESSYEMNSNGYRHKAYDSPITYKSPPVSSPPQPKADVQVLSQREQELRLKIDAQKRLLEQLSLKKAQKSNGPTQDIEMSGPSKPTAQLDTENQPKQDLPKTDPNSTDLSESATTDTKLLSPEPRLVSPKEALSPLPEPNSFQKRPANFASRAVGRTKLTNSRTSWTPTGSSPTKAFKLDNRSCTLAVQSVPSSTARENLKVYLEQFGTIVAFVPLSEEEDMFDVSVKFSTRTAAEKALANGLDIPDVGKVTMNWVPVGAGSGPSTTATTTTTTNNATGHPQHIFIPGLRNSHHHHYPGSFSLVNHRPGAQSKAEDPTTGETGDKKSTAPHSSLTTHTRGGSDNLLVNGADTDDLLDDFCVDDEVDGCWKR